MKIDKIAKETYKYIEPYWEDIQKDYEVSSQELNELLSQDHDQMGLILKIHLIVEYYMTQNLERNFQSVDVNSARLTFNQKINLLPKHDSAAQWLKPGIKELNKIRNKFAHNLKVVIKFEELIEIKKIVKISRDISHKSVQKLLNEFAIVAGSFLGSSDPKIVKIFEDAFKKINTSKQN